MIFICITCSRASACNAFKPFNLLKDNILYQSPPVNLSYGCFLATTCHMPICSLSFSLSIFSGYTTGQELKETHKSISDENSDEMFQALCKYTKKLYAKRCQTCHIGCCNFFDNWLNSSFCYSICTNLCNIHTIYKCPKNLKIVLFSYNTCGWHKNLCRSYRICWQRTESNTTNRRQLYLVYSWRLYSWHLCFMLTLTHKFSWHLITHQA